jgi:DNA-binding CsgD family transcriptional regulator
MVHVGARTTVPCTVHDGNANPKAAEALRTVSESFSPADGKIAFAPTEFVGNAAWRIARLARQIGVPYRSLAGRGRTALPSGWALIGGQPLEGSLALFFPSADATSPETPYPHGDRSVLGLVGAHLGAALRLRSLVGPTEPEAVLSPSGNVLHATDTAKPVRESLVSAVLRSEQARGRMRKAAPQEAMRAWEALVRGQWTIVETVERDGKRLLLARRNPLRPPGLLDLTADERSVAWLAACSHSYKYIAYELGIPLATVASRLRRAMRKLRITNRGELIQRLGVSPGVQSPSSS